MKILVIDDDPEITNIISLTLRVGWAEAEIISAHLGEEGLQMVEAQSPDIVILDLGLPDISGFEVLKGIRLFSNVPVLILTVSDEELNIVKTLELGANEYITKPFRQMEFLARLKSLAKKFHTGVDSETYLIGQFSFHPSSLSLVSENKFIHLTPSESTILLQLVRNQGRAMTYSDIANRLWDRDYPGASDAIRVNIRNLRHKIEVNPSIPRIIITEPGVGYSLSLVS
jgi:DNA-binding response OmpR family regulator